MMIALRLFEQNFIFQLSRSLLALFLMFWPMIPLTFPTAIFYEKAAIASLQFDVITSSGAAGGTALHHHCFFIFTHILLQKI